MKTLSIREMRAALPRLEELVADAGEVKLEHIAAYDALGAPFGGKEIRDQRLACVADCAKLAGVEDALAQHEAAFIEFLEFARVEAVRVGH